MHYTLLARTFYTRAKATKLTQSLSFFVAGTPISSNVFGPLPGFLALEGGGALDVAAVVGFGCGGAPLAFSGGFRLLESGGRDAGCAAGLV